MYIHQGLMHYLARALRIFFLLSGGRHASLKFFGSLPEKTRKLEFYIRPVETRTTNISGMGITEVRESVAHVTSSRHICISFDSYKTLGQTKSNNKNISDQIHIK